MNLYTPGELVRIELLQYPDAEGLHPVEASWRQLCRKLFQDLKEAEKALEKHHSRVPANGACFDCGQPKEARRWPEPFKPDANVFQRKNV